MQIHLNIHNLGSWHGFVAQQNMIAVKNIIKRLVKKYLSSGWMVAALRSEFGPPDQSMHEKLLFQH
jgi:isocitrate lyase